LGLQRRAERLEVEAVIRGALDSAEATEILPLLSSFRASCSIVEQSGLVDGCYGDRVLAHFELYHWLLLFGAFCVAILVLSIVSLVLIPRSRRDRPGPLRALAFLDFVAGALGVWWSSRLVVPEAWIPLGAFSVWLIVAGVLLLRKAAREAKASRAANDTRHWEQFDN
jgi:hypothetical protein